MLIAQWTFEFTWTDGEQVGTVDFRWAPEYRTLTVWDEARENKTETTLTYEAERDDGLHWKLMECTWSRVVGGWERTQARKDYYAQAPALFPMIVWALDNFEEVEKCAQVRFGEATSAPVGEPIAFG